MNSILTADRSAGKYGASPRRYLHSSLDTVGRIASAVALRRVVQDFAAEHSARLGPDANAALDRAAGLAKAAEHARGDRGWHLLEQGRRVLAAVLVEAEREAQR